MGKVDFFISYTKSDRKWAEWIAWEIESVGYQVIIQAWDFRPGTNFIQAMHSASSGSSRTLAVLSDEYLSAAFTVPEWAAAFAADPTGKSGRLLPVRVKECNLEGLLPQIVHVDLVGLDEQAARTELLRGIRFEREKPTLAPMFPGKPSATLATTASNSMRHANHVAAITTGWHNLPRRTEIYGRSPIAEQVSKRIVENANESIISIEGPAGIGKSAIALDVAHSCLGSGAVSAAVWISVRDYHGFLDAKDENRSRSTLSELFVSVCQAFDQRWITTADLVEQQNLILSLLGQHIVLLIIDNIDSLPDFEFADVSKFLLSLPESSKAIITSRRSTGLGSRVSVPELSEEDSRLLVNRYADKRGLPVTDIGVASVCRSLGGVPTVLKWVVNQAEITGESIESVAGTFGNMPPLELIDYCLERSWNALTHETEKSLLICLAIQACPIGRETLLGLSELETPTELNNALATLIRYSLIPTIRANELIELPASTRAFVLFKARKERARLLSKIQRRQIVYYEHLAASINTLAEQEDYRKLIAEKSNILQCANWCYLRVKSSRSAKTIATLAAALYSIANVFGRIFWQEGLWQERLSLATFACQLAREMKDDNNVSVYARNLGWIKLYQGIIEEAAHFAEEAYSVAMAIRSNDLVIAAARLMANVELKKRNPQKARALLQQALDLAPLLEDNDYALYSEGYSLCGLAELSLFEGNFGDARENYLRAISLWESHSRYQRSRHIPVALAGLGAVALAQGDLVKSREHFLQALSVTQPSTKPHVIVRAKAGLAEIDFEMDNPERGRALANDANDICQRQGMHQEREEIRKLLIKYGITSETLVSKATAGGRY